MGEPKVCVMYVQIWQWKYIKEGQHNVDLKY